MRIFNCVLISILACQLISCAGGHGLEPFARQEEEKQKTLEKRSVQTLLANNWCSYFDGSDPSIDFQGFLRVNFREDFFAVVARYDEWNGKPVAQTEPEVTVPWLFNNDDELTIILENSEMKMSIRFQALEERTIMHTVDSDTGRQGHMWDCNGSVRDSIPTGYGPRQEKKEEEPTDTEEDSPDFEIDLEDLEEDFDETVTEEDIVDNAVSQSTVTEEKDL